MEDEEVYHVFNKEGDVEVARGAKELGKRLREKPDEVLRREIATHFAHRTVAERQAIAFAEMELDRRAADRAEQLARKTTWIATLVGAGATIAGALLAVWLGS